MAPPGEVSIWTPPPPLGGSAAEKRLLAVGASPPPPAEGIGCIRRSSRALASCRADWVMPPTDAAVVSECRWNGFGCKALQQHQQINGLCNGKSLVREVCRLHAYRVLGILILQCEVDHACIVVT
jgi:hypothetical protein